MVTKMRHDRNATPKNDAINEMHNNAKSKMQERKMHRSWKEEK